MYTFGPLIAKNSRSGRLLGGAPVTVTTLAGTPLSTVPAPLVTNHEGYLPTFTVDTDQRVILARPRGGDPLPLYAHEGIQDAAEAADTINTGRLSEDALSSTFVAQADTGAAGLAVLAAALPADAREALGITIDTSVGTRVFVGNTMIYGDTGWRDMRAVLELPAEVALFRRTTHEVTWILSGVEVPSTNTRMFNGITGTAPVTSSSLRTQQDTNGIRIGSSGSLFAYTNSPLEQSVYVTTISYPATDRWLNSLPGTPA